MNRNKFLFLAVPLIALLMLFTFSSCDGSFNDPGLMDTPGYSSGDGGFGGGKKCEMCGGSGDCYACDGTGKYYYYYYYGYSVSCTTCGGSGKCPHCKGKGKY